MKARRTRRASRSAAPPTYSIRLQASLYQAFFQAWQEADDGSLVGLYLWNWDPNAAEVGPDNGANFSPQGLPAQAVIAAGFLAAAPGGIAE